MKNPELLREELEALFLNSDGPVFEDVRDAISFAEAEGIAIAFLDEEQVKYRYNDLVEVIDKIRDWEG